MTSPANTLDSFKSLARLIHHSVHTLASSSSATRPSTPTEATTPGRGSRSTLKVLSISTPTPSSLLRNANSPSNECGLFYDEGSIHTDWGYTSKYGRCTSKSSRGSNAQSQATLRPAQAGLQCVRAHHECHIILPEENDCQVQAQSRDMPKMHQGMDHGTTKEQRLESYQLRVLLECHDAWRHQLFCLEEGFHPVHHSRSVPHA